MSIQNVSRTPSLRLLRIAIGLFVSAVLTLGASAADTARVSGTVVSKSTGNVLQGAQVTVQGRSGFTDESGHFVIFDVPVGNAQVVATYSGFKDLTQDIVVAAGAPSDLTLTMETSDVVQLEAFTVQSVKEGQALSVTQQRNAANVKNVVALDEWGILPTQNIGELFSRLPGISFTIDEDNLINNVSVRGMPSSYTRLNVDGLPTTGVGGDGRSATLHSFSAANYEQIEVIAGQTPDKRADSLGGQLNLKTRSPLAMTEKRRVTYSVGARWSAPWADRSVQRKKHPIQPVTSFSYQERFDVLGGTNNLGISINASYSEIVNMIVYDSFFYQGTTDPTVTPAFNDYTTQAGQNTRFITGMNMRADYRVSPRTTFSLRFLYNTGSEPYYDRVKIDPLGNTTVGTTGTASILPGFTENRTELRQTGTAGATRMDLDMWRFGFYSKNPTGTFVGEHDLGALKLDYALRWSNTRWHSAAGRDRQGGQLTMRADNIGFILDKSNLDGQVFTQTAGKSVFDPASYTSNIVFTKRDTVTRTNEVTGSFNAIYTLPTAMPIVVKAGADSVNRRVNNFQVNPRRWTRNVDPSPASGSLAGAQIPLSGYALMELTPFEVKNGNGLRIPIFDPVAVSKDLGDTTKWTEDVVYAAQQPYVNRRILEEGVDSAYVQATAKWGKLTMLGGTRFEAVQVNTFNYIKRFSTSTTVEPDPVKRAAIDYQGHYSKGTYDNYFPSVHFAYEITPSLKARASWSTSYGRPSLAQLVPSISFSDANQTVTAGNPALKPQYAKNIDLKLEYYPKTGGVVSFGVFQKKITDYIINRTLADKIGSGPDNGFEGNFEGYTLTAPVNAGDAKLQGWEFDYRQRFTFLPGLLKGLGFSANYTWLRTTGNFGAATEIAPNDVPGFIPETGNARLTYNYKNLGLSAGVSYTGEHISGAGAEPVSPLTPAPARLYRTSLTTYNLGGTYRLNPNMTLFIDLNNITQDGPVAYRSIPSRMRLVYLSDVTVNFGISGQF